MNIEPFNEADVYEVAERNRIDVDELVEVIEFIKEDMGRFEEEFAESVYYDGHGEATEPTTIWEDDEYIVAYCDVRAWESTMEYAQHSLDVEPEAARAIVEICSHFAHRKGADPNVLATMHAMFLPNTETVRTIREEHW